MLVLTRKNGESLVIGENITIKVISAENGSVRLGVDAPREIPVYRQEIYQAIREENLRAVGSRKNPQQLPKLPPSK
ncbi:MAG: carbon storage regulator CsrA [Firmicutes bacterium]|nr:carbon storage regulator CsrA [Bacillota bacterium]